MNSLSIVDNKIPIPDPAFLIKDLPKNVSTSQQSDTKYEKEYDEFCQWSALPPNLRKPRRQDQFERKYNLPKNYTSRFFRKRSDYQDRRLNYFWDWMMDVFPDVVYNLYKQTKDNVNASKIFVELMSKKMNVDKPTINVAPMMLVGVSQERIDKLFIPKGYEEINKITPKDVSVRK